MQSKRPQLRFQVPGLLIAGVSLAVLLLVNSISNYVLVSRKMMVDHVREHLSDNAAQLDRSMRNTSSRSFEQVDVLLEHAREQSSGRITSLLLRNADGALVARAGADAEPAFQIDFLHAQFSRRRPAYKLQDTAQGRIVIEAFPVRLPAGMGPAVFRTVANSGDARPRNAGVVEIAALLDGMPGSFRMLERSLLINSSGALALLAAMAIIGLHLRPYMEGQHLERQLAIARRVQADLLPAPQPAVCGEFTMAALCVAANGVGGDFYDAFSTTPGCSAIVLGDVSGKGIPAALLMGVIHGAVRSSAWTESAHQHASASALLNRLLYERSASERYATMFWGYFDSDAQALRYINAGHCPPLLFRGDGEVLRLDEGGPVLGLVGNAQYVQGSISLQPGDILIAYSDGIVEARNRADEFFGEERLIELIHCLRAESAGTIRNRIVSAVETFTGNSELEDDRTLLVARYSPVEPANLDDEPYEREKFSHLCVPAKSYC